MIEVRVATKIDQEVNILQSGFRPKMGTREGTFNLRTICERALEVGKEVHICFIDYTKEGKYNKFIIDNNKEKKMPVFLTRNKSGVDPKIVTRRQNWREERTGETKSYLDEKKKKKHQRMVRTHL